MKTSQRGLDLIKRFEGLRLEAYEDVVGVWTIGYGCTAGVTKGMTVTPERAVEMLAEAVGKIESAITPAIHVPVTQEQFDAIVSLAYNVGPIAIKGSTLLCKLNQGDARGAADEFLRWDKAAGHVVPGLALRRSAERLLFLGVGLGG